MTEMTIPEDVQYILTKIENEGHIALLTGGAMRDMAMLTIPKDYDIATNCDYDTLLQLFKHHNPKQVGRAFGVMIITINEVQYEIAKFRSDGSYSSLGRPDEVEYVDTFRIDAKRRDFTINAMGFSLTTGFTDPYDGASDIERGLVRFIGNPSERILEDPIRMMRAVRFANKYDFKIVGYSANMIMKHCELLKEIPVERIVLEFNKILLSNTPSRGLDLLNELGILKVILPELYATIGFEQKNKHHDKDLYHHIVTVLDNTQPILVNRLSALFHDISKPECFSIDDNGQGHFYGHEKLSSRKAREILKRMMYDNHTIDTVARVIRDHMNKGDKVTDRAVKRFIERVGEDNLDTMFDLFQADIVGHKPPHNFEALTRLSQNVERILSSEEPIHKSHLAINGNHLIEIGVEKGPYIGELLELLFQHVLEFPQDNTIEILTTIAKKAIEDTNT